MLLHHRRGIGDRCPARPALMKIVRRKSGLPRRAAGVTAPILDAHGCRMLPAGRCTTRDFPWSPGHPTQTRTHAMKWETPQAMDQRFGFEITMYIANR
jgi:coenzyme PQQ precursor peptide PqqA